MIKSVLKFIIKLSIVLAIVGAIYQYRGSQADEKSSLPVGKMVDIGGYKLHMIDSQAGKMTVVIDSGIGGKTLDWCLAQPEIAKFARVVTYDRAGYAWSDASPLERTSDNIVQELHTMLHNAKVPAPYLLVGYGFGGLNMRLFASRYPDEVAGMVLVDAAHEDVCEKIPQLAPSTLMLYAVLAANYCGVLRALQFLPSVHKKMVAMIASYPVFLQRIYLPLTLTTKFVHAMTQESLLFTQSCQQLKLAGGLLGNKPLTVMTSGRQPVYEVVAGSLLPAQQDAYQPAWLELQADLVKKSSRGKQVMITQNDIVMVNQPRMIVAAVREMVKLL